jgi:putative transposase
MSKSLSCNYIHLVFSKKNRINLITHEIEIPLHKYITGICTNFDCPVIQINGVEDHIHILLMLSKNITLAKIVEEIKKNSSKWVKQQFSGYNNFYWQTGYGAFSVSPKHVGIVTNYILRQKEHHKKMSYQEEFIQFLTTYKIEYDERYIWD